MCYYIAADCEEVVDEVFPAALSRFPGDEERKAVADYFKKDKNRTQVVRDLMRAVMNTKEFIFNH